MNLVWSFIRKRKDYIDVIGYIIFTVLTVLWSSQLKSKLLFLVTGLYGVIYYLGRCFADLGWKKGESIIEKIYKIMGVCIIVGGCIVLVVGILGDSTF